MRMDKRFLERWKMFLFPAVVEGALIYGTVMELMPEPSWLYFTGPYLVFLLLAGLRICIQGNNWKEWLFTVCMGGIALLSYRFSCERSVLLITAGICYTKDVKLDRLFRWDLYIRVFLAVLFLVLPMAGVIPNHMGIMVGGRPRTFFGWNHPNSMGRCVMLICMEWMYFRHGRFRWYDYAGLAGITIFLDMTANSRAAEFLIVGMIGLELLSMLERRIMKTNCRVWTILTASSLTASILLPLFSVLFYEQWSKISWAALDTIVSRMYLTWDFLQVHGLSLFGSAYILDSNEYLDMFFASVVLLRGLVFGLIVIGLSVLAICYAWKRRDERYMLLLFVFFAYGMMESEYFRMIYTFFPALLGIPVFNRWQRERPEPYEHMKG